MKPMQFLMGLDDTYMQIRSSILSRETLSNVKIAYAIISSEESHRVASGSISGTSQRSQASTFVSNVPNKGIFQRNKTFNNTPRPDTANNNKQDRFYPFIVGSNSSSGFTDEKLSTLISLIKDNSLNGKNVQANMARFESEKYSRIGNQREGLYYSNNQDPVLNVLKQSLQIDNNNQTIFCEIRQIAKQPREYIPLSDHTSKVLGDLSDSSHSSVPGEGVNIDDFPSGNFENDAQSSDDTFAAQNEQVTTLEDDIVFEGIVNQNPSTSTQSTQNLRKPSRQTVFPRNYNDFVINLKVNEPKTFFEASKFAYWTDATNNEMDALLRNDIWEITELPKDRKAIDVNNAFLYGDLVETVYVKPPEGYFPSGDNKVCKLKKSFQSKSDYSLYAKSDKVVFVALLVYVDDIIITGLGIHITKSPGMNLKAYSDDDWEKCVVTRRSVTGTVYI
ncbi:hypothetical protein Tco_0710487 [Tanacetum coccineum]